MWLLVESLKIPYALDPDGNIVWPAEGCKGADYTCPDCGQPVFI